MTTNATVELKSSDLESSSSGRVTDATMLDDQVFTAPEKLSVSQLRSHWTALLADGRAPRGLLLFLLDLLGLGEEIWPIILPKREGPGRRPKTRLGQFFFFVYLLYFSQDAIDRALRKVNQDLWLQRCLCVAGIELTSQTFDRFLKYLGGGPLDTIFQRLVHKGICSGLITLNRHVIDTGKVHALVNPRRFVTWPTNHAQTLGDMISQLDLTPFDQIYTPLHPRSRISGSVRLKIYLVQILGGLVSLSQVKQFLTRNPALRLQIGLSAPLPCDPLLRGFWQEVLATSELYTAVQALGFTIACHLGSCPEARLPASYQTLEDLYGALGTKYARVDPGARVGYKSSTQTHWTGYKDHVSIDEGTGLPVHVTVTSANVHDTTQYLDHVTSIQELYGDDVQIQASLADKGYDSAANRAACQEIFGAEPRIKRRGEAEEAEEAQRELNSLRQAVERAIGAATDTVRKDRPRVRGRTKVTVWVKMSYTIILLIGLMAFLNGEPELINCRSMYK